MRGTPAAHGRSRVAVPGRAVAVIADVAGRPHRSAVVGGASGGGTSLPVDHPLDPLDHRVRDHVLEGRAEHLVHDVVRNALTVLAAEHLAEPAAECRLPLYGVVAGRDLPNDLL